MRYLTRISFLLFLFLSSAVIHKCVAQLSEGRTFLSLNDGWKFYPGGAAYAETVKFNDAGWESISLPHTWNATDVFDDDLTYRRGISWYRKEFVPDPSLKQKNLFLYFEGANQLAKVYVNGYFAGEHKGGYTGFSIDITSYIDWESGHPNTIAVELSNAHNPFIPPLSVGYASYGGIYRDVWIISTGNVHFATINNNAGGVYITTPVVNQHTATVAVQTTIKNETTATQLVEFENILSDPNGKVVTSMHQAVSIPAGGEVSIRKQTDPITDPSLWHPDHPYLYKMVSRLLVNGKLMDEVKNRIGFRWFSFDDGNGFSLNGKKLILHGTNRHQDMQGKGDALSLADHRRDMELIKNMGCNFVRLAHYPQAAEVLRLADELGLLIWEETPVVNYITRNEAFLKNTEQMIREMIVQGYNHPSVIMWGSNNEILLHGPDGERIGKQNDTAYMASVKQFTTKIDSTVRAEDPYRRSTMAMHISSDYAKYGLDTISQVAGYNIYSGWYSGKVEDFGNDLDRRKQPGHNVFISEYGAEGETSLNTEHPVRFDYTGQYQRYYHESYLRQINQRPWLAGTAIWNEFDFSQPNIGGPQPHRNQKGLITWDRKPKDAYYFYKANWNPEPMVYIATRDWTTRAVELNALSTIDVYSNATEVTLLVNGTAQKKQKGNDIHKFSWQVHLQPGMNKIAATAKINGKQLVDDIVIDCRAYDAGLKNFTSLAINAGSNAQYLDPSGTVWMEDRPYTKGSFGYTGGTAKAFDRKDVILHTDDEPLFYSYIDSIASYRFDVEDGEYRITLCMAEPSRMKAGDRIFSIELNGEKLVSNLDLTNNYGFASAVTKTFIVSAKNNQGVVIKFISRKGNPLLNGIKIEKY